MKRASSHLFHLVLCLAGFVLAARAMRATLPNADATLPQRKLELFAQGDFDTVFVGSSRVQRHLDPASFDAALAATGRSVRSFNLGVPLMLGLEQEALVDELFAAQPDDVRLVVIDPEHVELASSEAFVGTARAVDWHTTAATLRSTRGIVSSELGPTDKLRALRPHWSAWFRRETSLGAGHRALRRTIIEPSPTYRHAELAPDSRGYLSLDEAFRTATGDYRDQLVARRQAFLELAPTWPERVRAFEQRLALTEPNATQERALALRLQAQVEAHGARAVFFIAPGLNGSTRNYLRELFAEGAIHALVDFGQPAEFPEFFAAENLFDDAHLVGAVARRLTERLAAELCAMMDTGALREL